MIFIIVRSSTKDIWLNDKMLQITQSSQEHLVNGRYPTVVLDDYESINNYLNQADFLFVQSAGDFILDFDHIWNKLHSIPDDQGLVSHITWDVNSTTPFLEKQCFIIRTAAVKTLEFSSTVAQGKTFIRSKEDLHNGHAPVWVKLTENVGPRTDKFGTLILEQVLSNGYAVSNFDLDWRYSDTVKVPIQTEMSLPTRGFLYPEVNTEIFSRCLKNLELDPSLDDSQAMAISVIKETMKFNYINALHWDDTVKDNTVDLVIAPANGLMAETLAYYNNAKKIIIYDINKNNIEFKKTLYNEFDGNDYFEFFKTYATRNNLKIEPATDWGKDNVEIKETQDVIAHWDLIKNIEKEYIVGDLFSILDYLISQMSSKTLIHTSTIMGFYIFTNVIHDRATIRAAVDKLQKQVEKTDSIWLGER